MPDYVVYLFHVESVNVTTYDLLPHHCESDSLFYTNLTSPCSIRSQSMPDYVVYLFHVASPFA
jgi:hypothetical protein